MPVYQIEMLWSCGGCRYKDNLGLNRHCENCGKPKDDRDEERFPEDISEANALTGEKQRKALAGPDWKCKYCDTLQNRLGRCCINCGCDKNTGEKPWDKSLGEVLSVAAALHKPIVRAYEEPVEFKEPSNYRDSAAKKKPKYGYGYSYGSKGRNESNDPDDSFYTDTFVKTRKLGLKVLVVPAVVCLTALILWLVFRTKIVDVQVSALSWEHRVLVERYQVWLREGWTPESSAFDVHNNGSRVHHYDHVKVGSHQESYQESYACGENCTTVKGSCYTTSRTCTSNKNGTASCSGGDRVCSPDSRSCSTKYCSRTAYKTVDDYEEQPRYRDWYSWKAWDWGHNRVVKHSGTTLETSWPTESELTVPLQMGEKERNRRESMYKVTFTKIKDTDTYSIAPKTLEEFKQYPIGNHFRLKVGVANGVDVLSNGAGK